MPDTTREKAEKLVAEYRAYVPGDPEAPGLVTLITAALAAESASVAARLAEAEQIIKDTPVLVIDAAAAIRNDDVEAIKYARAIAPWMERSQVFLASPATGEREDWKLVPIKPTEEMKRAAFGPIMDGGRTGPVTSDYLRRESALVFWKAMVAAAPKAPSATGERETAESILAKIDKWLRTQVGGTRNSARDIADMIQRGEYLKERGDG